MAEGRYLKLDHFPNDPHEVIPSRTLNEEEAEKYSLRCQWDQVYIHGTREKQPHQCKRKANYLIHGKPYCWTHAGARLLQFEIKRTFVLTKEIYNELPDRYRRITRNGHPYFPAPSARDLARKQPESPGVEVRVPSGCEEALSDNDTRREDDSNG